MVESAEHRMQRLKNELILALEEHYSYAAAARAIHIDRATAYRWREDDPVFAMECERARRWSAELLEGSVRQRAEKSDLLAIFMTKGMYPERYRDNVKVDVTGEVTHRIDISSYTEDERRRMLSLALTRRLPAGESSAPPEAIEAEYVEQAD